MSQQCKVCGKRSYSEYCFNHKPRKPIRQQGKHAEKWKQVRQEFLDTQPDIMHCYLCNKLLTKKNVTIDHVIPRSRRPDLRYDFNNLQPCCWSCNLAKGSVVY